MKFKPILFYDMFPAFATNNEICADYSEALVISALVNKQSSTMQLSIEFKSKPNINDVNMLEHLITREYGLSSAFIDVQYPNEPAIAPVQKSDKTKTTTTETIIMGKSFRTALTSMDEITLELGTVAVKGEVCDVLSKYIEKSNAWVLNFDLTDYSGSIRISKFMSDESAFKIIERIKTGMYLKVSGRLSVNRFENDIVLEPNNIIEIHVEQKTDDSENKRVELHLHTKMSAMDAVTSVTEAIENAVHWGHPAIAITDHGVLQAFPEASAIASTYENQIKVIYGLEGYYIDDKRNKQTGEAVASDSDSSQNDEHSQENNDIKKARSRVSHIILLAKNQVGLRNLYKLVTKSHLQDFNKYPIIYRSALEAHREGLIVGSACEAGELFHAVTRHYDHQRLCEIADFYDYLEIQPICNNMFMLYGQAPLAKDIKELQHFNKVIYDLGQELGKPVVATGDVHFLKPEHEIFRKVLMSSKGFNNADEELPLYFRTTAEMLEEFSYLGQEQAYEVVITNTASIASMCDYVEPLPPKRTLFVPELKGSSTELSSCVNEKLLQLYGENPPELVMQRLQAELKDIFDRNYSVIFIAARNLVQKSLKHGYLVGSRGSVGSSFVAFLADITEVNALPAHYLCPECKFADFNTGTNYGCGADLPNAVCPKCGTDFRKDGFDIPFETFLGFDGDKVPDIDLNFSGEYQSLAHQHAIELFGSENVFRAGTIGKIAAKTAYGYVKNYLDKIGKSVTKAEENRLTRGCLGVKRTTGQHPGGLIVIPQEKEITDFCPAQYPADSRESKIVTTHFEYKCMEDNLVKLDALGHDDPTMIKMLEDLTGQNATAIRLDDQQTLSIFSSPYALGLPENDDIIGATGVIGIPEFGTPLTRQMLIDTKPDCFDTLVRISGFSHGEDVWSGNAKELILSKTATVAETISCREDIMLLLISKGMNDKEAFKISESVRKGKGLPEGAEEAMKQIDVAPWYIESCKKIQYLFPKAHAVAYVMMAFRIAWFKVHYPLEFYSAYFYRRSQKDAFDAECMTRGINIVLSKIKQIKSNPISKQKDEDLLTTLEACYEFYTRGFEFAGIDLYESDPVKFLLIDSKKLRPPFISISGLGEASCRDIAANRTGRRFISVDDFSAACPKISAAHLEQLKYLGALRDLPQSSQMSLFG